MKFRSMRVGSVAGALVLLAQGLAMVPANAAPDASLAWVQKHINVKAYEGTSNTQSLDITFSGGVTAPGATIHGNLRDVAAIDLSAPTITSDGHASVTLTVNLPVKAKKKSYVGNIQLTDNGKPLPRPLHVSVQTAQWDSTTIPTDQSTPSPDRIGDWLGQPTVVDQLMVGTPEGLADPDAVIRDIAAKYGGQIAGSVPGYGLYALRIPGATVDSLNPVRDAIAAMPNVDMATHTVLATSASYTNDSVWKPSPAQNAGKNWNLEQIDAPEAWDDSTGAGVSVGIIDGGFYPDHEDLKANVQSRTVFSPGNDPPHGTHVAGTACASGNNDKGSVGVGFNCRLVLAEVDLSDNKHKNGAGIDGVAKAIIDMGKKAPRVVNASLAWGTKFDCTSALPTSAQADQYNEFMSYRNKILPLLRKYSSTLWVFAAGNEGVPAKCSALGGLGDTPGLDNVVTVAASTKGGGQAHYSEYGEGITVAAPGGGSPDGSAGNGVYSTYSVQCSILNFINQLNACRSTYSYLSGTSMAAPHVTGTAALAFAADPDKQISPARVKQCLIDGAAAGGKKIPGQSYSIINAKKTVDCALGRLDTSSMPVTAFSTNAKSAFAQRADGSVWAWGDNTSGQLGIGTDVVTNSLPTPIPGLAGVKSISTGLATTFALMNDGTVRAWGDNSHGLLGNGTTNDANAPLPVPGLSGVRSIVINESDTPSMGFGYSPGLPGHTVFAVMNDGTVMAWGENPSGVLGNGTTDRSFVPTPVHNLAGAVEVASQGGTAWALKNDGTVAAWGDNTEGQLGTGQASMAPALTAQPVAIDDVTSIRAGFHALVALKDDGTVWGWGAGSNGLIEGTENQPAPVQRSALSDIAKISVMRNTGVAVKKDGTAWGWGWNGGGEAGVGIRGSYLGGTWANNIVQPAQMPGISNVTDVRVGMALTADGTSWQWAGQIFGVAPTYDAAPMRSTGGVASILPVQNTRWVIKTDGTLWGWGQSSTLFTQYAQYAPGKVLG